MTKEELLEMNPGDPVLLLRKYNPHTRQKMYQDAEIIQVSEGISDCTHIVRADIKYQSEFSDWIVYAVKPEELER